MKNIISTKGIKSNLRRLFSINTSNTFNTSNTLYKSRHLSTSKRGFTLIELLVVMMIIAVLAGLSLFSFQGARKQGRDVRRKTDLELIKHGLELYKADCNRYPGSLPTVGSTLTGAACSPSYPGNVYIQRIPGDPATNSAYQYSISGTSRYTLTATLEDCTGAACNYQVTNP